MSVYLLSNIFRCVQRHARDAEAVGVSSGTRKQRPRRYCKRQSIWKALTRPTEQ